MKWRTKNGIDETKSWFLWNDQKIKKPRGSPFLSLLFNIVLEVLARAIGKKNK